MENKNVILKRIIAVLMAAILLLCVAPLEGVVELDFSAFVLSASALAKTGNCGKDGDNVTWSYDGKTKELIISGIGEMKEYFYSSGTSPFAYCDIKSVVIENGVTNICAAAFEGCYNLLNVLIGKDVTKVGYSAFEGCTSLKKLEILNKTLDISSVSSITDVLVYCYKNSAAHIYLAENNKPYVLIDGDDNEDYIVCGSFGKFSWSLNTKTGLLEINGNGKLPNFGEVGAPWKSYSDIINEITFHEGFSSIGSSFNVYTNLKKVNLPYSVTSIDSLAFSNCLSLVEVTIPNSVKNIGAGAFLNCTSLEKIAIPDSVTSLDKSVFEGCNSLKKIDISNSVKSIGNYAFKNCTSLKNISISDNVTSVGVGAFYGCTSLENMVIPDSLTNIERETFYNCTKMIDITIPDSVIFIGENAFGNCNSLKKIHITDFSKWYEIYLEQHVFYLEQPVNLLENGAELYLNGNPITDIVVPDSVDKIRKKDVKYFNKVNNVFIPDTITEIGYGAFSDFVNLKKITIPSSVERICGNAFGGKLEKIEVYSRDCEFSSDCGLSWNTTIFGYKGSTAERLANDIGAEFVDIEEIHKTHNYEEFSMRAYCSYSSCACGEKIKVKHKDENNDIFCDVCKEKISDVNVGKSIKMYEDEDVSKYIIFTPVKTSKYSYGLYSIYGEFMSLSVKIYDEDRQKEFSTEDILEKGKTYYICCTNSEPWGPKMTLSIEYVQDMSNDSTQPTTQPTTAKPVETTSPTTQPTTVAPTTQAPVVTEPTTVPTTAPSTTQPTTVAPTTQVPVTAAPTQPTTVPSTTQPTTQAPVVTTTAPTTAPTTQPTTQPSGGTTEPTTKPSGGTTEPTTKPSAPETHKHTEVVVKAVAATYTKSGLTEGKKCSTCGEILVAQKKVARKKLKKVTSVKTKSVKLASGTKSTLTLSWKKVTGAEKYVVQQYVNKKWKTVATTKKTSYTIKKLKANKSYKFRVRAAAGKYYGSYSKTYTAKTVPLKPTVTVKAGKKQFTASWKTVANITGYEVQYSTSKKFTKKTTKTSKITKAKTTKKTIKSLKKGKKYYVKVRAYKTVGKKKIYGSWSTVKTVNVK